MVKVERMRRAIRSERFRERVFTQAESDYCRGRADEAESLAGIFAAKEAAVKALGRGNGGFGFCDVEITHDALGAPQLLFHGEAAKYASGLHADVSITHDGGIAAAIVMTEKRDV